MLRPRQPRAAMRLNSCASRSIQDHGRWSRTSSSYPRPASLHNTHPLHGHLGKAHPETSKRRPVPTQRHRTHPARSSPHMSLSARMRFISPTLDSLHDRRRLRAQITFAPQFPMGIGLSRWSTKVSQPLLSKCMKESKWFSATTPPLEYWRSSYAHAIPLLRHRWPVTAPLQRW